MNWESVTIDVPTSFLGIGTFLLTIVCFIIVYKSLMFVTTIKEKSDYDRTVIERCDGIAVVFGICGVILFLMTIRLILYGAI